MLILKIERENPLLDVAHEIGDKIILNAIREPSSMAESNEPVKGHEPSTRYEEAVSYLRPNIRNYHTYFRKNEFFQKKSKVVIDNFNSEINEAKNPSLNTTIYKDSSGHLTYALGRSPLYYYLYNH